MQYAEVAIMKLDGIPEAFFVRVGEEEFPGLAAVGGFVEAGEVAGPEDMTMAVLASKAWMPRKSSFSAPGGMVQVCQR